MQKLKLLDDNFLLEESGLHMQNICAFMYQCPYILGISGRKPVQDNTVIKYAIQYAESGNETVKNYLKTEGDNQYDCDYWYDIFFQVALGMFCCLFHMANPL